MLTNSALDFSRGSIRKPLIALTFDGGGGQSVAPEIQAALGDLRCTMFITGSYLQRHAQHVLQLLRAGHEFGNHTFSHRRLYDPRSGAIPDGVDRNSVIAELDNTAEQYRRITGQPLTKLWRAPFGARNQRILEWAGELGLRHIHWTHDTADWRTDPSDPLCRSGTEMLARLERLAETLPFGLSGAVVLLHLGAKHPNDPLYLRLPNFIRSLQRQDYRFVTVSELLAESDQTAILRDAAPVADTPLPVDDALDQIGWHEGFYADGWAGADSTFRVRARRPLTALRLRVDVPVFFARPMTLRVWTKPKLLSSIELAPCGEQEFSLPTPLRCGECVEFYLRCEQPFNCSAQGINADRRDLAFRLIQISAAPA